MPVTPTYPGVYVHELTSGVRTITGVSTSVTAFLGSATRGPINRATRIHSFSEFERRFGGLSDDSEMSYAVRQFFSNGGGEAVIVRVALNAAAAFAEMPAANGTSYLKITAVDDGRHGNNIEARVDYNTQRPNSTFNLTIVYANPDNPSESAVERFTDVSMNSDDPRFVERAVNGNSELVVAERINLPTTFDRGSSKGVSLAGSQWDALLDPDHNTFWVAVDGGEAKKVTIPPPYNAFTSLAEIVQAIDTGMPAELSAVVDVAEENDAIKFTSATSEKSSVRIFPASSKDAAATLGLGEANGGTERDAASSFRPVPIPTPGSWLSGEVDATIANRPAAGHHFIKLGIDQRQAEEISLGTTAAGTRQGLADLIQKVVREHRPADPAFRNFTAAPEPGTTKIRLTSGTPGKDSKVTLVKASLEDVAEEALLDGTEIGTGGESKFLSSGDGSAIGAGQEYDAYIGAGDRKGIRALDGVDFNLMCMPGISEPLIVSDAAVYCQSRRAFLIVDAPPMKDKPVEIAATVAGPEMPKTNHAAIYYPWIKIGDPLKRGKPRKVAPSGTIAGLYARTDSSRGVWKAPAGTDGPLVNVQGTDYLLTDAENGMLNPRGINCIRVFPVYGPVAWGARTLEGDDDKGSEWKYVPVRRTALYIEESLYRGLKWVVFEPNDEPLWGQIRLNVGAFMHNMFRQGAFQGSTPRDAYFVKCDKETTTQNDINLGVVNIIVGFAPLKPAEFVMVKIQQMAGQIQS